MHQGARTDPCGGRGATRVPTATRDKSELTARNSEASQQRHWRRRIVMQNGALIDQIGVFTCHIGQEARLPASISCGARKVHCASVFRQSRFSERARASTPVW